MEAPGWWLLVTVLMAPAGCLPLVNQDSDLINPSQACPAPPRNFREQLRLCLHSLQIVGFGCPGKNILFSPASISLALAMLILGVPEASRTQLLEGLGLNLTVVPEAEIQEGFRDLLLSLPVQDRQLLLTTGQHTFSGLGLGAIQEPMEAQKRICEYVERQTQGKLGVWMEELRSDTVAVLVNHLLLRGKTVYIQCRISFWELGLQSLPSPTLDSIQEASPADSDIGGTR